VVHPHLSQRGSLPQARVLFTPEFSLLRRPPASGSNAWENPLWTLTSTGGPCVIKALVAAGKAAPSAIDISSAEALRQIVAANGFASESDYDSDDLPKGPIANGGDEADTPRHCEGCGQFLANPLTGHGLIWVEDAIRDCLTTRKATAATTDTVNEWADFYKDELDFRRIVLKALEIMAAP
jgi:hypothetical protein